MKLHCYRCGHSLEALSLPLARLDVCPQCAVELHVCRMCELFRPRLPSGCAEEDIEEVRNKERANFCDYFTPSPNAYSPPEAGEQSETRAQLAALFGDELNSNQTSQGSTQPTEQDTLRRAEDLFKS